MKTLSSFSPGPTDLLRYDLSRTFEFDHVEVDIKEAANNNNGCALMWWIISWIKFRISGSVHTFLTNYSPHDFCYHLRAQEKLQIDGLLDDIHLLGVWHTLFLSSFVQNFKKQIILMRSLIGWPHYNGRHEIKNSLYISAANNFSQPINNRHNIFIRK